MQAEGEADYKNYTICETEVVEEDNSMGCQWCGLWTHRKCIKPKITKSDYKAVKNSNNDNLMFVCSECQPMIGIIFIRFSTMLGLTSQI